MDELYHSTIKYIVPEQLRQLIVQETHRNFTIVDVRDSDYKYLHIKTSVNYPSYQFHEDSIQALISAHASNIYIFHCMRSQNRGPKCAKRFIRFYFKYIIRDDFSNLDELPKVYVLKGGFKKWYELFGQDTELTVPI